MRRLGSMGICPDADTMEYFLPAADDEPARGSFGSSHYNQKLRPHGLKQRSLLRDLDLPEGLDEGIGRSAAAAAVAAAAADRTRREVEPYFKAGGGNKFGTAVKMLQRASPDADFDDYDAYSGYDGDEGQDAANLSEEARLTLAEAALVWANTQVGEPSPAALSAAKDQPVDLAEQFLFQRGPSASKRRDRTK